MGKNKSSEKGRKARVLIVDDHPVVRRGLAALLGSEPDLEVCGEAGDMSEALRQVEAKNPDLVMIDISLKTGSGIELLKQIKARDPKTKMLVSSMHDEFLYAERCLRAGAMGYVMKHESSENVVQAVRNVLKGQIALSPRISDRLLRGVVGRAPAEGQSPVGRLTDRELEVFEMIGEGMTTSETAERLHLSVKTIEAHRESIKRKLNVDTANELTRTAMQWMMDEQKQ